MTRFEPLFLLLGAGFFIGLVFPLSHFASVAGTDPLAHIGWSAFGASLVLLAQARTFGGLAGISKPVLRYAVLAGALTYAIPFGALVFVVPQTGTGIPSIFQSLAPILTLGIVVVLGMERPGPIRLLGLALGLVGMLTIVLSRGQISETPLSPVWLLAALVTPAALAVGNVYRSAAWPQGESPIGLAALSFVSAGAMVLLAGLILAVATGDTRTILVPADGLWVTAAQALASGIGYRLFFRLQKIGGPVYLSQISYVNTGVGLAFAVVLFREPVTPQMVIALTLIVIGVSLVNRSFRPKAQ